MRRRRRRHREEDRGRDFGRGNVLVSFKDVVVVVIVSDVAGLQLRAAGAGGICSGSRG